MSPAAGARAGLGRTLDRNTGPARRPAIRRGSSRALPEPKNSQSMSPPLERVRARLSYRRAAELLVAQTGWTLHQFRHSALTHLAEDNVQLPLLMAKSRHRSLRTLQRYARPGPDAVAALTAAHDPARRR